MIKQGDMFTVLDLQQSMREVCGKYMRKYIDKRRSVAGILIGDCMLTPINCTPEKYAATCIQAYGDTPSSAINLDRQLRDKGFKTTYRFSYKYDTGNLTPQQIIHDAYCLDWFQKLYETAVPLANHEHAYYAILNDAFSLSYYYAQYLWAQNQRVTCDIVKALNTPDVSQWPQIISAILGTGFQFHPADVYEHAIEHISPTITRAQFNARHAEQLAFKNEMMNKYGIDMGCLVLSPQNREKLRKIVTRTDPPYCVQVIKNIILGRNR